MEAIASNSCFLLVQPRSLFPDRTRLAWVRLPLISSVPHFPRLVLQILRALVTLPMRCPLFPLCFTTVQQPCIFSFILQDLRSFFPCCGTRDFVHESSTSLCTLDHLRHLFLMHLLYFFSSSFFLSFLQPIIPLLHGVFPSWMDPRFLTVCRQQLSNPPSAFSVHSSF